MRRRVTAAASAETPTVPILTTDPYGLNEAAASGTPAEPTIESAAAEASVFEAAAAKEQEQALKDAAKEQARLEKEQAKLERELERERQKRMRPLINAGSSAAGSIGRDIGKAFGRMTGSKEIERAAGNAVSSLARGLFKTFAGKY